MLQHWTRKFRCAIRGVRWGVDKQSSFLVHLPAAAAVVLAAAVLGVAAWEWCVLLLSIAIVVAAELFNTAIEGLVRRLHPERHPEIGRVLDISAGAVLVTALGAAAVGLIVLGGALLRSA
ncbi:diacylglycerol kinase [Candidatus Laterigemmans baculatus]|uniref:diacylglycerol kinase n=1 Tax=Candidatus Laterigemmans baculatus TaxID=2770505 RepID=UPI0013DC4199|nr:diacylglycerol kinase [Candidatus Laterigemmans baculatus]